jgi:uncharacterized protein (DUF433 family)
MPVKLSSSWRRRKVADQRELPMYRIAEVALYVRVPESTLHSWIQRPYSQRRHKHIDPLIFAADERTPLLSFFNMAEAHILLATREYRVHMQRVRRALECLREKWPSPHPLLDQTFRTEGKNLFIEIIGEPNPVNVSAFGQVEFREFLEQLLVRIEPDIRGLPEKISPVGTEYIEMAFSIRSGRPVIKGTTVLAEALWDRAEGGEDADSLADDYDVSSLAVKDAIDYIRYNQAAA